MVEFDAGVRFQLRNLPARFTLNLYEPLSKNRRDCCRVFDRHTLISGGAGRRGYQILRNERSAGVGGELLFVS